MINYKYKRTSPDIICVIIFIILTAISFFTKEINAFVGGYKYYFYAGITVVIYLVSSLIIKGNSPLKFKKFFMLRRFKFKMLPATFYAAFIVCLLTILATILLSNVFKISLAVTDNPIAVLNEQSPISSFLAVVLAPAIFEELFFRGAYFSKYKSSGIKAFIATSIVFALMHATPSNLIGPIISGLVFCILVFIFDSIYPAILAHLINNLAVILLNYYSTSIHTAGLDGLYIVVCLILVLIFIYLFIGSIMPYLHKISDKEKLTLAQRVKVNETKCTPFNVWFFVLVFLWCGKCIAMIAGIL